jgi:hypothetical protein
MSSPKVFECPKCDAVLAPYQIRCEYCGARIFWSGVPAVPTITKADLEDDVYEEPTDIRIRTDVLTRTGYGLEEESARTYPDYMRERKKISVNKGAVAVMAIIILLCAVALSGIDMVNVHVETDPEPLDVTFYAQADIWVDSGLKIEMFGLPDRALTNTGLEYIRDVLTNGTTIAINPFRWIAIGTGHDSTPSDANALVVEYDRLEGTFQQTAFNEFKVRIEYPAGSFDGETIQEIGLFNAYSGGVLLFYQSFTGITLYSGDSLAIDVTVTLGE